MQLPRAARVADGYRHLRRVLHVYREVFDVASHIEAVQAIVDQRLDPLAPLFSERFDGALERDRAPDIFLRAVVAYHLFAESLVARTARHPAAGQHERFGDVPDRREGQRLVARDGAGPTGIGAEVVSGEMMRLRSIGVLSA